MVRAPGATWDREVTLRTGAEESNRKEPGFLVTLWSCCISSGSFLSKLSFFFFLNHILLHLKMHHYLYIIKKKPTGNKTASMLCYYMNNELILILEMLNFEK